MALIRFLPISRCYPTRHPARYVSTGYGGQEQYGGAGGYGGQQGQYGGGYGENT
jgi:hypothetical protein